MQSSRRLRLGILSLIAGTAFLGLLGFVLQGALKDNRVNYYILFEENVKGMVVGSKVNFQGVPFGMVSDIRFQSGSTLVELSVDPSRAVIQDITRARLDRLLVTGQVTVELEGFGPDGVELRPGQFITPTHDPINQLTKTLPEVVEPVLVMLDKMHLVLDRGTELLSDENLQGVSEILQNANAVAGALPESLQRVDALLDRAELAMGSIEQAADGVAAELVPAGVALAQDARLALEDLRSIEASMNDAVKEGHSLLRSLRAPTQSTLTLLRTSLGEFRDLARQLRLAPDSLLFGVTRPASPAGGRK